MTHWKEGGHKRDCRRLKAAAAEAKAAKKKASLPKKKKEDDTNKEEAGGDKEETGGDKDGAHDANETPTTTTSTTTSTISSTSTEMCLMCLQLSFSPPHHRRKNSPALLPLALLSPYLLPTNLPNTPHITTNQLGAPLPT